jgi:hypothetical protein
LPIENASLILEIDGKQFWVKVNAVGWVWKFYKIIFWEAFEFFSSIKKVQSFPVKIISKEALKIFSKLS